MYVCKWLMNKLKREKKIVIISSELKEGIGFQRGIIVVCLNVVINSSTQKLFYFILFFSIEIACSLLS